MTITHANANFICVTASYFCSQVDARSKHYLIETEDNEDTAGERFDMATLNRKAPDCNADDCLKKCRKIGGERWDHVATWIRKRIHFCFNTARREVDWKLSQTLFSEMSKCLAGVGLPRVPVCVRPA